MERPFSLVERVNRGVERLRSLISPDPRPMIYQSLHFGNKNTARELLWRCISRRRGLFTDHEWDKLYLRAGGLDEGDRYLATRRDL